MDFLEIKNISEREMDLLNPFSEDKVRRIGQSLTLEPGDRVIDFGCGFAEVLILWAQWFGITGIGIDIRPYACSRAEEKITQVGLLDKLKIVCQNGSDYPFEAGFFDVAACFGATFIWGGFRETVQTLKKAIRPGGQIVIGEAYWRHDQVPSDILEKEKFPTELEIWQIARDEGLTIKTVARASETDWDRYQSAEWQSLLNWIEENPSHPDCQQVIGHLLQGQKEYFSYGRAFLGWGVYVLG
jgi:cyclopropane fatty-acyl-phospholipid synthase-like methyltransferase